MTLTADLGPGSRAKALDAMEAGELDVLVVGAGVVGAGTALDAVSRGLSTALVEQRDFASGTSSRSSKLVHGGLRYLEMFDFGLVREALEERGLLLTRIAPHLVRPVPFLYPLHHTWERPYVGAGLILYDGMAQIGARAGRYDMGVPKHKHLFRRQLARMAPDLRTDVRPLPGVVQRVEERHGTHQVWRDPGEQQAALLQRFPDQPEVEHLEVAKAAVHQLRRAGGSAAGEVALLYEGGGEPAGDGVERRTRTDDTGPDHEHVQLTGLHGVEGFRARTGSEISRQRHANSLSAWWCGSRTQERERRLVLGFRGVGRTTSTGHGE